MSPTHTPHEPGFNPALSISSFTGKQSHHPTHPSAPIGTSLKPPPLEAQTSWVKFALMFCLSLWWHFGDHASPAPTWSQPREEGVGLAAAQEWHPAKPGTFSSPPTQRGFTPSISGCGAESFSSFLLLLFAGCLSAFFNFKAAKTFSGHKGPTQQHFLQQFRCLPTSDNPH